MAWLRRDVPNGLRYESAVEEILGHNVNFDHHLVLIDIVVLHASNDDRPLIPTCNIDRRIVVIVTLTALEIKCDVELLSLNKSLKSFLNFGNSRKTFITHEVCIGLTKGTHGSSLIHRDLSKSTFRFFKFKVEGLGHTRPMTVTVIRRKYQQYQ